MGQSDLSVLFADVDELYAWRNLPSRLRAIARLCAFERVLRILLTAQMPTPACAITALCAQSGNAIQDP
jgi:hypothetical protein